MNIVRTPMNAFLESRRFAVLLITQLLAIFVAPLIAATPRAEGFWFRVSVWSVLARRPLRRVQPDGRARVAAVLLLVAAAYAWLGPDLHFLPASTTCFDC